MLQNALDLTLLLAGLLCSAQYRVLLMCSKFVANVLLMCCGLLCSCIDMYNNDVGQESAQKFMKQTGDLKAATLYFAS